jgi:hypothetical protein
MKDVIHLRNKPVTTTTRKIRWLLITVVLVGATLAVMYTQHSSRSKLQETSAIAGRTHSQESNPANSTETTAIAINQYQEPMANKSGKPILDFSAIDESVVGQPFKISASVKEGCKNDTIECPLVMASIARLIKEPRDVGWAARMEDTIHATVDRRGSGEYVIRNLECRASICILEVECRTGTFTARYDDAITSSLRPNALTIGVPEYDPSGTIVHVELMDFERR